VVAELGRKDMGEKTWTRHGASNGPRRCRRLHDAVTFCATHPGSDMADDLKAGRQILQHLGDIFPELLEPALADRTTLFQRKVSINFARKMVGQNPFLPGSRTTIRGRSLRCWFRSKLGLVGFEFLQLEFELLDLPICRSAVRPFPSSARTACVAAWRSATPIARSESCERSALHAAHRSSPSALRDRESPDPATESSRACP